MLRTLDAITPSNACNWCNNVWRRYQRCCHYLSIAFWTFMLRFTDKLNINICVSPVRHNKIKIDVWSNDYFFCYVFKFASYGCWKWHQFDVRINFTLYKFTRAHNYWFCYKGTVMIRPQLGRLSEILHRRMITLPSLLNIEHVNLVESIKLSIPCGI